MEYWSLSDSITMHRKKPGNVMIEKTFCA